MADSIPELVSDIKAGRIERTRRIPVHRLTGAATELLPPGSGALVLAAADSELFEELDNALAQHNTAGVNDATDKVKPAIKALKTVEISQALEELRKAASFADLYFGPKAVAVNVFPMAGTGFTRVFFPFVGGDFEASEFRLVEYATETTTQPLQAFVAVHEPPISARERAVLRRLPDDARGMLFGPAGPVVATPAALVATVTVGILVAVVGTALTRAAVVFDQMGPISLNKALEKDATLAIRDLLAARRDALAKT